MPNPPSQVIRGRQDLYNWHRSRAQNFLDSDPNLQHVLQMYLGEVYHLRWPMLYRAATLAATEMDALATECSRTENLPRLERFDRFGNRMEDIRFHPSYLTLGAQVWSTAVLKVLEEPGNGLLSGSLAYLVAHNGEAGHVCPVACTAGLIRLLQRVGSQQQREQLLPRLLQTDYSRRLHASQFITEVQGGSDVGANACTYRYDEQTNLYHVSGEKWFCSVADAGAFVISARAEDAPRGTAGLRLFMVPRMVNGEINAFVIRRLKDKLGTRSLATAEIDFFDAVADPLGPEGQGVRYLTSVVLDTSRVYNAVAACGMMRRAFIEAQTYAQFRRAFGSPIIDFPAVQRLLAEMKVLCTAGIAMTFRVLQLGDQLERGEAPAEVEVARRVDVMINKYWTALRCSEAVRMGVEVLGGNGTIEDFSVLPRLYRDALVLETWEGTHNTLCAQLLRDFSRRGLHQPWLDELERRVAELELEALAEHQRRAEQLHGEVAWQIQGLINANEALAAHHVRHVVDRMCLLSAYVSLLLELQWELRAGLPSNKGEVVDFFWCFFLKAMDPADVHNYPDLLKSLAFKF